MSARPRCPRCSSIVLGKRRTGANYYRCSACSCVFDEPLAPGAVAEWKRSDQPASADLPPLDTRMGCVERAVVRRSAGT